MREAGQPLIRAATVDDAASLAELGARTFRDAFATQNTADDMAAHLVSSFSPDIQRAEIRDANWRTLLAEINATMVGYAQVCFGDSPACIAIRSDCIELRRIYVDKSSYGYGIGAALMNAAKDAARSLGAGSMWLGVWERNDAAQRFYMRHGFEKVGTKIFQVGSDPQQDDVLLCELD